MEICFQKKKQVIYSEACPEVKLRALANAPETRLLTDCCRLALRYAEETPLSMPDWFTKRYMKFCKDMTKEKGAVCPEGTACAMALLPDVIENLVPNISPTGLALNGIEVVGNLWLLDGTEGFQIVRVFLYANVFQHLLSGIGQQVDVALGIWVVASYVLPNALQLLQVLHCRFV